MTEQDYNNLKQVINYLKSSNISQTKIAEITNRAVWTISKVNTTNSYKEYRDKVNEELARYDRNRTVNKNNTVENVKSKETITFQADSFMHILNSLENIANKLEAISRQL